MVRRETDIASRRALTGAWIETIEMFEYTRQLACRALTGAWIETLNDACNFGAIPVAPSRARGLKHPTAWHESR